MSMRLLTSIALIFCVATAAQDAEPKPKRAARDSILFRNGDALFGTLGAIDAAQGIRWIRSDAVGDFSFEPAHVSELALSFPEAPAQPASSNLCTVQLTNGDQFQGILQGYDGEKAVLETWYGGRVEVPKTSLALLIPMGLPKPVIFEGPTGVEGWTMGRVNNAALVDSGEWHYQNKAFYAVKPASIARDMALPDSASLQFDLEWRGFFHVAIALYTEYLHPINLANKETEPKFGGFYSMQINPFSANLLPVKQFDPLRYLGQAPLQNLTQKSSARFDIRVNKAKKLIALLIDGVVVKQWVEQPGDDFAGTGTSVRFVHQGQGAVKLSNVRITEWDGTFDEAITITQNKPQDLARLKNGDRVFGTVKSIQDGKMNVESGATVLDVPLTRVKQIELAAAKPAPVQVVPATVRAVFSSGAGSLTFDLEKWSAEGMTGTNAHLGALKLDPAAFSKLVFDLGQSPRP
jgi:hypothetical protein